MAAKIPPELDVTQYHDPCFRVAHEIAHVARALEYGDRDLADERLARVKRDIELVDAMIGDDK